MTPALRTLIEAASLAPSGDNTQPWKFAVDDDRGEITVIVDETRDLSPMNAGQRMARIAVGAAVENLERTAIRNGWPCEISQNASGDAILARVEHHGAAGIVDESIRARVTNRACYDGTEVPRELLARLSEIRSADEAIQVHWFTDRSLIDALSGLIGRADALMFGDVAMLRAFLANVRFDAPADEPVAEGLPIGALHVSAIERMAIASMRRMPDWLLGAPPMRRTFFSKARRLVTSASGLCLITASDRERTTDYLVGRTFQRAWLALTELGLAVQPMMSLPVLDNGLENGARAPSVREAEIKQLLAEFERVTLSVSRVAALLRFGFEPSPRVHTGRRQIEAVTQAAPALVTDAAISSAR